MGTHTLVQFAVAALAGSALVRAWLAEEGIFTGIREWTHDTAVSIAQLQLPVLSRLCLRVAQLAQCRFCLSY
jgi:hypothetical protein